MSVSFMIAGPSGSQYHLYKATLKTINPMGIDVYSMATGVSTHKIVYYGDYQIQDCGTCKDFESALQKAKEQGLLLVQTKADVVVALPIGKNRGSYLPLRYNFGINDGDKLFARVGDVSDEETAMKAAAQYALQNKILHVS